MPEWKQHIRERLAGLKLSPQREAEIIEEVALHLDERYRDARSRGLSDAEATRTVLAELDAGGHLAEELSRVEPPAPPPAPALGESRGQWFSGLGQDLRYALRMLRKNPGFTAVAVLTLALGIGANTAVFSLVYSVLLHPLPYPQAERAVTVWQVPADNPAARRLAAPANFLDWRERATSFAELAGVMAYTYDYVADGQPETFHAVQVSEGFLRALGIRPVMGRDFLPEDFQPNAGNVVLMSHGLWQQRFGGDPDIIGHSLVLNGQPYTVVGVLPEGFDTPVYSGRRIYAPLIFWEQMGRERVSSYIGVLGRLREGVTLDAARAEMTALGQKLAAEHPRENSKISVAVLPLHEHVVGAVERPLWVLLGAVGLVLLIACANVGNLLLARGSERTRELAIRAALGAHRGRLVRQLLAECLLVAVAGTVAGVFLAQAVLKLAAASGGALLPRLDQVGLHPPVLAFSAALALLTVFLAGLLPALHTTRHNLETSLRESGRATTSGRASAKFRHALVGAQVALAVVLLVGAGLLLRSFSGLLAVDPGFATENLAALRAYIWSRYPQPAQRSQYVREVLERLRATPGIRAAAATMRFPFMTDSGPQPIPLRLPDRATAPGQEPRAAGNIATPDYFSTLGIPLLRGRVFREPDDSSGPRVAVINETMARRIWPDEDPIGKSFGFDFFGPQQVEVVGIVGDVRQMRLENDAQPEFFIPHAQSPTGSVVFIARTESDAQALLSTIQSAIWQVNPEQPFYIIATMDDLLARSLAQRRFTMASLGG
ncbi:MAG TPA: ABC transporter permease, partial [Candidatus Acidoferrales bacterium]